MMAHLSASQWDEFLSAHPQAHLLQTTAWGELKSRFGWDILRLAVGDAGAQVLFRRLPLGFTIAYIPKGPLGNDWQKLLPEIETVARSRRAVLLKIEPDGWEPLAENHRRQLAGYRPGRAIQPRRTLVIDLTGGEDDWLAQMKQKCRYNIRLAEKKGVTVHPTSDLDTFHALMQVTGGRDGFGVHSLAYYRAAWELFAPQGKVVILQANFEGKPLAALMVFRQGSRAWYFYGASSDEERNRMPTYLLQFAAMRWAAENGCISYDLWGVPDADAAALEAQFEQRHDGLWGVYRFKRGFGGQLLRTPGAWDKDFIPLLAQLYRRVARRRGGEG